MKRAFPWIAIGIGITIMLILFGFQPQETDAVRKLPLLTALLMAEFGFLVNITAFIFGIKNHRSTGLTKSGFLLLPVNFLLAVALLLAGLKLWPGISA